MNDTRYFWISLLLKAVVVGFLCAPVWAGIGGNRGFWGYSSVPSARLHPQDQLTLYGISQPTPLHFSGSNPSRQWTGGLLATPLSWLEVGATLHHTSYASGSQSFLREFSLKVQVPRYNAWQPLLAFGVMDLAAQHRWMENLFFSGGYEIEGKYFQFSCDLGAIYHFQENVLDPKSSESVTSFWAMEASTSWISLMLETLWSSRHVTVIPSVWFKPLSLGPHDEQARLVLGGGYSVHARQIGEYSKAWGALQFQLPLNQWADTTVIKDSRYRKLVRGEPLLWIDVTPHYDFSYGERSQYRVGFNVQAAIRFWVQGLYWVNEWRKEGFHSGETDLLEPHEPWDRSYLLFVRHQVFGENLMRWRIPSVAVGILDCQGAGGIWIEEKFRFRSWPWASLKVQSLLNEDKEVENQFSLRHPLHPTLPWVFRWAHLYGEGGIYTGERPHLRAGLLVGSERNFFDLGAAYDLDRKDVVVQAFIQVNWGWGTRIGDVEINWAPSLQTQIQSAVVRGDKQPMVIQGNYSLDPYLFPWQKRSWRGDSLRELAAASCASSQNSWDFVKNMEHCASEDYDQDGISNQNDQCPTRREDRDGFSDQDGCPDLDNDGDLFADQVDSCPLEPEDRDHYQDGDGCPDLDNDQDGVEDSRDLCNMLPEDRDAFEDEDGCPDLDNDQDGIPDLSDNCPNQAGPVVAGSPRSGCPQNDDFDGIPYEQDACPLQAEDLDHWFDEDGCPDLDNDQDGIPDDQDQCPNIPEVMDGINDLDGC